MNIKINKVLIIFTMIALSCTLTLSVFAVNDETDTSSEITSSSSTSSSSAASSETSSSSTSQSSSKPQSESEASSSSASSTVSSNSSSKYYDEDYYSSSSQSSSYDYKSSEYETKDNEIYNYIEESSSGNYYSNSSSYSKNSIGTASLLEGNSSKDDGDDINSQDWNKILENINKSAKIGNNFTFSDTNEDNSTSEKNDGWLFWLGISLIVLSIMGIWWVVYTEYFSRKSPRMMNMKSNATANKSLKNKKSTANNPDKVSSSYGDGYNYSRRKINNTNSSSGKRYSQNNSKNNYKRVTSSNKNYSKNNKDFWDKFFDK